MKIGITMFSFHRTVKEGKMGIQQFIEYCGKEGYDSLDILSRFWKDRAKEEPRVREWVEKAGVKLLTYALGNHLLTHDKAELKKQMEDVREGIVTAAKLGAPYVRVFGGSKMEGFTSASAVDRLVECFGDVMGLCEKHNVTLGIENHGVFPGTATEVKKVVEGVNNKHFTALFDTGNWLSAGQDPIEAAHELKGLVGLVHVKDMIKMPLDSTDPEAYKPSRASSKLKKTTVGEGEVPNAELMKILSRNGFDGYATIEAEGPGDEYENAAKSLAYLRKAVATL